MEELRNCVGGALPPSAVAMAASTPESSTTASLKSALDFFGKDDPEGVEKFKTVAFRALHEQRVDEELRAAKAETARLQSENAALASELRVLQASFDANVGDRERVLAFKSKRIEELNRKLRSAEATAASLRQTLTGSETTPESAAEGVQPLFHALATCRESEFRRLCDEQRVQCEQLTQQLRADAALASEQQAFYAEKAALEAELAHLRDQLTMTSTQHEAAVHFLERKLVFEHDRLQRANDADVAACRDAMETRMRAQLDATTQRTVAENARVQLELRFQNRQLEQLLHELDRVTADKTRAQQETRVVEAMSAQLSKRLRFYEQLFAKMQERDAQRLQSDREGPVSPSPVRGSGRERSLPRLSSSFELDALPQAHEPALGSLDSEGDERDGGEQLNAAADALETHLQHRELARKHVDAMLRYHTTRHARQQAELLAPSPVRAVGPLWRLSLGSKCGRVWRRPDLTDALSSLRTCGGR